MTTGQITIAMSVLGIVGAISFAPAVPKIIRQVAPPQKVDRLRMPLVVVATVFQASLIVVACAALGAHVGHSFGLRSLLFARAAESPGLGGALAWAIVAGAITGAIGGAIAVPLAKPFVAYLRGVPMVARLLYGGFSEEVIIRWGFMSGIVWLLAKAIPGTLPPPAHILWLGVALTNVIFVAGHVPIMRAMKMPNLAASAAIVFLVTLPWGWLFWTFGIESAMAAHMAFHVVVEVTSRRT